MLHSFPKASQYSHFFQIYRVDLILSCFSLVGVIFYILHFTTPYPSKLPSFEIFSTRQTTERAYNLLEITKKETLIHISYTSTTGFRNKQQLQRFAFTNKDVEIIDIFPLQLTTNTNLNPSVKMDFETFYSSTIPKVFIQKLPILFYINTQGDILDYHIGTIEYADLLDMTAREK